MRAEHADEFLERLQPGSHGRVHPLEQILLGPPRLLVVPEQLEGFFQVCTPLKKEGNAKEGTVGTDPDDSPCGHHFELPRLK